MMERSTPVEFRMEGRTLRGVALRYGERARDRAEMFEAGAFQPLNSPISLNLQHDAFREIASTDGGSLRIEDTPTELRVEADLREGSAELTLVRRGALKGLSVEFRARQEDRRDGVRVISAADLSGIGLVDSGSYRTEVELRARMSDTWLRATIPYNTSMACECQGPTCSEVEFEEGAFDDLLHEDVLAVGGDFLRLLGSTRKGTLLQRDTGKGFEVGLTRSDTDTARKVIEAAKVGDIYVRPLVDPEASDFVEEGTLRRFSRVSAKAWLVKPTTTNQGHKPATVKGAEQRSRRRIWL